jgi:prepilin-type N-terminal cleavage/methylation domain-containing protein
MKISRSLRDFPGCKAFTLTELMVTLSLLLVILAGVLLSHFSGMQMFQLSRSKLGANEESRRAINLLMDEVRTAKLVKIGSGSINTFNEVQPDEKQQGSAIQIYPTASLTKYIRYFWDSSDNKLKRTTNGTSAVSIVANSITNSLVFTSEDHLGNILENNRNNRVIGLTLQFYQIQFPIVKIGPGQLYDFYQIRAKITRRSLE